MDGTRYEQKKESISPLLYVTEWLSSWSRSWRSKVVPKTKYQVETPRSIQDRADRTGGDGHGKRRVFETSGEHSHEGLTEQLQTMNEEFTERIQAMSRQVFHLEEAVASREHLIGDIEVKFTDYLKNYNENVASEINTLNRRLSESTNELAEYQVELMVAAREDEGSEIRIQELERRGNMMERSAARIYQKGMEMREEYENQDCLSIQRIYQANGDE